MSIFLHKKIFFLFLLTKEGNVYKLKKQYLSRLSFKGVLNLNTKIDREEMNDILEKMLLDVFRKMISKTYNHPHDISFSQMMILKSLQKSEKTVSEIADVLQISSSGVTALCDKLVYNGYIDRERSLDDRRQVFLRINSKGEDALLLMKTKQHQFCSNIHDGFSDWEKEVLQKLYQKILENI